MLPHDQLLRFNFDELDIRGELVYLDAAWRDITSRYDYPHAVQQQLGSALAAVALLSVTLKFKGTMILQIQGSGPLRSLVTQATSDGALRGLARWDGVVSTGSLQQVYGDGHMLISLLPDTGERYQSIVALTGTSLADALNAYFEQSEQLPSSFRLFVAGSRVAGLFLQALPLSQSHAFSQEQRDEDWQRLNFLAATVAADEMFALDAQTLLLRLFHEEAVRLHAPKNLHFACTCSREKVERTLLTLGRDELLAILRDKGNIDVDCEFCNQHYSFDTDDVERLCMNDAAPPEPERVLH
ncbi:MAG: Hsp33 family molecular chaperone HslO [Pseudomonadales bacterium]|jgi:molecular chaperone Hsp33|nr:Hsp33 family molecular chaperone HslO [Pseudomonadales bacterium]